MEWSADQKKIIDDRGKNILVSAAAGSGKTAVMVERIINMISDENSDVSLDNVVIMTFTDAAANGMKAKIAGALGKRIAAEPDNKKLKRQRALLPRADISTIHSFCNRLIKQNYQALDIDPGFRLCDEAEAKMLKNDVLTELLEEKYAENADEVKDAKLNELILSLQKKKDVDGRLTEAVENIYKYVSAQPFVQEVLDKWSAECEAELKGDYEESAWYKWFIDSIHEDIREHKELLELAVRVCQSPGGPSSYEAALTDDIEICESLLSLNTYEDIKNFLDGIKYTSLKASKKDEIDGDKQSFVKDILREGYKKYLTGDKTSLKNRYFALSPEELDMAVKGQAKLLSALLQLTGEFIERFDSIKREKNILDFNDLEHMAIKLLYTKDEDGSLKPSPLADELAKGLTQIMIDEYQDSSNVQEALLKALSGERFGKPNVFMVGDVKQSIYRFRNARPELFNEKYDRYEDSENTTNRKIELDTNFRSRKEVLDSVNAVFDLIMTKGFGGIEYAGKARLSCGNTSYPVSDDKLTEIIYLDTAADSSEDEEDLTANELEARVIAERIKELTGRSASGKSAMLINDEEASRQRPVSYRDITILVRRKAIAAVIKDVLNKNDIPAFFDTGSGYYDAKEVNMMISFLNIIDNPLQDIPLVTVLKGIIGDFDNEELALIRAQFINSQDKEYRTRPGDYFRALSHYAENGEDDSIKRKSADFIELLNDYRDMADAVPVHVLLNNIYVKTGYYDYVSALDLGEQRRKNLDMLLKKAEDYGKTDYQGLFNFVRYVEILRKNESDSGEALSLSPNDDVVNITTIHSSKGLEYPVVFLAGAASGFGKKPEKNSLELSELGIGMDYLDPETNISYPSLKRLAIKKLNAAEEMAEEQRLLYVAMTRAKEKLIITGASGQSNAVLKKPQIIGEFLEEYFMPLEETCKFPIGVIRGFKNYLAWIISAASVNGTHFELMFPTIEELNESAYMQEKAAATEYADILTNIRGIKTASSELIEQTDITAYENELQKLEEKVKSIFTRKYPYEEETRLKSKISVSEIKKIAAKDLNLDAKYYDTDAYGNVDIAGDIANGSKLLADIDRGIYNTDKTEDLAHRDDSRDKSAQNTAALRGTAYHRAMELLSYNGSAAEQQEELLKNDKFAENEKKLLNKDAVISFLESKLAGRMCEAHKKHKLFREQHFMVGFPANSLIEGQKSDELQLLQGIIDAYFEEDGELVLVDYKTDRVQTLEVLKERYGIQLELYKRALEQLTDKKVKECIIYSTCLKCELVM